MNMKILFITNRNVLTTCGALRLIKNRAEVLYSQYNVSTDFCVFQNKNRLHSAKKEDINAGGQLYFVGYTASSVLFSYCNFQNTIIDILSKTNYDAIIISQASFSVNICKIKKLTKAPIFIDGHGASEDIYTCIDKWSLTKMSRYLAYQLDKFCLNRLFKYADGCLVVSDGLKEYYENRYLHNSNFKYFRIPCATTSFLEEIQYKAYREQYRLYFGLKQNEVAFVYSGGIEPWQCVNKTIELYKEVSEKLDIPSKMFIFSYETELINQKVKNDSRFVVRSLKSDELTKALCAMDFGFLIREDTLTNNVAYPNKFLEYLNARIYVITTPYIYDVKKQIEETGVGFICKDINTCDKIIDFVNQNLIQKPNEERIKNIIFNNSFNIRLKYFINYLGL